MRAEPLVLVVDDEPSIRTTVSMMLTLEGHQVQTAADGDDGLRLAADHAGGLASVLAEYTEEFEARTGIGVLLNTSLNRRGEPMVCSPDDALNMFFGSDLQNLALGDFLVRK